MSRRKKKKSNSPIIALTVLLLAIIGAIAFVFLNSDLLVGEPEPTPTPTPTATPVPTPSPSPTPSPTPEPTPSPTPVPIDPFLMLVNYDNPVPEGYEDSINFVNCGSRDVVDERIYDALTEMVDDAQAHGSLWIASVYRSKATQADVLESAIIRRMNDYGWSRETATEDALLVIAEPGKSEHNTGLAVDFNYVEYGFEDTTVYEWLSENCVNYGFIERYTKDKEDITRINYEPWHYRYVGVEHAQAMKELGMCLEEYVDYYYGNEE